MIKNIIFDMGNVLLDYNPYVILDQVCDTQEEKQIIKKELFAGPEWAMGDRGDITNAERFDLVKKRVPEKLHDKLRKCVENWDVCMLPVKGAGEFMAYVKEKGYGLYVLSNAAIEFFQYFPRQIDMDFFDGIVVSAEVHMLKPEIEIYRYLLESHHLKPQECLFIDDREDNVKGAEKAGLKGFVFKEDFDKVKEELES